MGLGSVIQRWTGSGIEHNLDRFAEAVDQIPALEAKLVIDRCWADYLAEIADIRDGIHLALLYAPLWILRSLWRRWRTRPLSG